MPELPEVETIRRDLEIKICGRRFTRVDIPSDRVPVLKGIDESRFREQVVGARVDGVSRRGKYLGLHLDTGSLAVIHLRMTGALLHRHQGVAADKYVRAVFALDDGMELRFSDLRKFGGIWLVDSLEDVVVSLGPEPLGDGFTAESLAGALRGRRAPVKAVILDQRRIAGIGNIYADEALFAAGIDPRRLGGDLSLPEVAKLHRGVRDVLVAGVESRGASFSDYRDVDGRSGSMQMHVKVFRRTGKPCYTCETAIERCKVGGRSTHFCPACQR